MNKMADIGVDFHVNSLPFAVVVEGERKLHDTIRLKNLLWRESGFRQFKEITKKKQPWHKKVSGSVSGYG